MGLDAPPARMLMTNCFAGAGGGEEAVLRHVAHSTMAPSALAVALLNDGPLADRIAALGVACHRLGRRGRDGEFPSPIETLQIGWQLARFVRRERIGHVMCWTMQDLMAALIARRLTSFRLVWRSQGEKTVFSRQSPPDARMRRFARDVSARVDAVVATTAWDAEALAAWGIPRERIRTEYLGVPDDFFAARPATPPPEVFRLVMSGRLVPWKGHMTLLRALARLQGRVDAVEAWIVGDGDPSYRGVLEGEARKLGIGDRVRFCGHRQDVRAILADGHIAVHCSEREPFGLVIIEAMAGGLPVIAAAVEGPKEILDERTGVLVPPGDDAAYARAIEQMVRDWPAATAMAERGFQSARQRFRAALNVPAVERVVLGASGS